MNLKPSVIHLLDHGILSERQKRALDERSEKNRQQYVAKRKRKKKGK